MNILGIDPGTTHSGLVFAFIEGNDLRVWTTQKDAANSKLLQMLRNLPFAAPPWTLYAPQQRLGIPLDAIAIESPGAIYAGTVGRETIDTIRFAGALEERAEHFARLFTPQEIRLHLCGTARAKDGGVRQALIDRFGKPGTKKEPGPTHGISSHAWRALAVATMAADASQASTTSDHAQTASDASEGEYGG